MGQVVSPVPDAARAAFESHDWQQTIAALEQAAGQGELSADARMMLGDAQYWAGDFEGSVASFESAFGLFLDDGRRSDAGRVAALLAYLAARRQAFSVARGWLSQAEQLLEGEPESIGHVWLKLIQMGNAMFVEGDLESAVPFGEEAYEIANRIDSPSGRSLALSFQSILRLHSGDWQAALQLIDEATVLAMAGDDLRITSDVYCNTIATCRNLGQYKRAGEWTEEADRWMRANAVGGYTGACQVHRAELKRLHGSWLEAEDEARRACEVLERYRLNDYLGGAHYEIGEIKRRMGDLEAAEKAFERAYEYGHDAQPGRSLLMMDRGDPEAALSSITSSLESRRGDQEEELARGPSRARLLPAQVEIALRVGDRDVASHGCLEIETGHADRRAIREQGVGRCGDELSGVDAVVR